ncbi:Bud-site selection protein [Annulohypoxylon truncatum]|uniref:Bud-site selection protein n=1 Tax=Annulohypoxylon truncatum TaxID=327061 RepID=UPI00200776F2|nr:Bud-site selection protein [Annulohypoxylon truncatum]KAI1205508.1 Bud-site selection protein [Annulohypoxylon truncatum]
MPKRKRSYEPSLPEKLTQWHKELARGMKTAKGFERQRLSKRIREAQAQGAPDKAARLEREVAVLKSLDLQQAAHAHLCSSLLKIKGVAESPRLPSDLVKPVPKPDGLSEEEKAALHNVTSALCNRKQIRDVIEEAVMGTCMALRVLMPDKMKKGGKDKKVKKEGRKEKEEQADERDDDDVRAVGREENEKEDEEESESGEEEPEPVLLKRKRDAVPDEEQELSGDEENEGEHEEPFEGFSGSDEEERVWSRYDAFVAGSSSDEHESDDDGADEGEVAADSKTRLVRKTTTADDISISSADSLSEDEDEDEHPDVSDSESSATASPPPSKKSKTARPGPVSVGGSAFLPSLMGGYISGSESEASDIDVGPPARKNRRGQRARQAIWEKKYKEKAKHLQKQQDKGRDQGWDMRRGAVGDDEGSNKPWKKGIRNPFENKNVHPERLRQMQGEGGDGGRSGGGNRRAEERRPVEDKPKPKVPPKRDDTGPLHPSWAAAKKVKEQKVEFQGRKVVFD